MADNGTGWSLAELDVAAELYDGAVLRSGEHAHFCSSTDWVLPAAEAFTTDRRPWIPALDGGYAGLSLARHPQGFSYLEPLEAQWGLACPVVGTPEKGLVESFVDALATAGPDWSFLVLSGIICDSWLELHLAAALTDRYAVRAVGGSSRFVADIGDGLDGFLGRRSRNVRRSLLRSRKRAQAIGVEIDADVGSLSAGGAPGAADALFERILAVEGASWKGLEGLGINTGPMCDFYRRMVARLVRRGRLHLRFARAEERDVGYILGARFGRTYRGLQFSFDADFAHGSVGNAMQLAVIEELSAAGVEQYDLGTTGGHYKARWSDREVSSRVWMFHCDSAARPGQ